MSFKRSFVFVAVAGFVGAMAYGCSSSESTPNNDQPAEAGSDVRKPTTDGATGTDTGTTGGQCIAADVTNFTPPAYKKAKTAKVCTQAQAAGYYQNCIGEASTDQTCRAFLGQDQNAPQFQCALCIETQENAAQLGATFRRSGVIFINLAGCFEIRGDQACATSLQKVTDCNNAACDEDNCPVTDQATFDKYNACTDKAEAAGCKKYVDEANACSAAAREAGTASDCFGTPRTLPDGGTRGETFEEAFVRMAGVFCGTGSTTTDASTD